MLEVYLFVSFVLTTIAVVSSLLLIAFWLEDRNRKGSHEVKKNAQRFLFAVTCIPGAWLWPLTAPALIVYALAVAAKDATRPNINN